jgi:hypothetical protein
MFIVICTLIGLAVLVVTNLFSFAVGRCAPKLPVIDYGQIPAGIPGRPASAGTRGSHRIPRPERGHPRGPGHQKEVDR